MANPYFQFKQFTIQQDTCAMKVCTDACILGAWFAAKISSTGYILDIGSGTGLLMLMLAQKTNATIHGIEIDLPSFKQSNQNITQNSWSERLTIFPGDVRATTFNTLYDFIICNPPFFENDLISRKEPEQVAKHSKELSLKDLVLTIDENLKPSGTFGILLPYHRWKYFVQLAEESGFYPTETLFIKHTPQHDRFRTIITLSRYKENFIPEFELIIKQPNGDYTSEFVELLRNYYLKF